MGFYDALHLYAHTYQQHLLTTAIYINEVKLFTIIQSLYITPLVYIALKVDTQTHILGMHSPETRRMPAKYQCTAGLIVLYHRVPLHRCTTMIIPLSPDLRFTDLNSLIHC